MFAAALLPRTVGAFQPNTVLTKHKLVTLFASSAVADVKPEKVKKERVTPEAIELADVFKEKEDGSDKLLVAQIAPSVR